MLRTIQYQIDSAHELHAYFSELAQLTTNIYNATLFRIRQVLTGCKKEHPTQNEQFVLNEIAAALPAMNEIRLATAKRKRKKPTLFKKPDAEHSLLSYSFLDALMKVTDNPDYCSKLPKQSAQAAIRQATRDVKGFFKSLAAYKKDPSKFTGRPKLTHYKHGISTIHLTNQSCQLEDKYLTFSKTKAKLYVGDSLPENVDIRQATICPYYGHFLVCVTYEDGIQQPSKSEQHARIAAIDFGVNNIAAIANNIGLPGLLCKGGIIKSANQWFNKKRSKIVHGITVGHETTTAPKAKSLDRLSRRRNGLLKTELHTIAKRIILWCVKNEIDTLVVGINHGWKQNSNIGHRNNQAFVGIPHHQLQQYLCYLCDRHGIHYVEQNEDYTSLASFLDGDNIPAATKDVPVFSGKRIKRGLYRSKDGRLINADINAAANILRQAFPTAFDGAPAFAKQVTVLT